MLNIFSAQPSCVKYTHIVVDHYFLNVFFFFHVCLKLQDASAEFEDSELRALRNKNCELVGMLFVGKKAPHNGNKFAGGRHRILLAFRVLPHFFPHPKQLLTQRKCLPSRRWKEPERHLWCTEVCESREGSGIKNAEEKWSLPYWILWAKKNGCRRVRCSYVPNTVV